MREELKAERSAAGEGVECPVCGQKDIKSLRHHVNYRAAAGDVAHSEYKASQQKGWSAAAGVAEQGPYFAEGSGAALVGILLSFILQRRPELVIPVGWKEAAADAHQIVLEKHVGPRLKEKSDLAYLGMVWAQLITVNMAAPAVLEVEVERHGGPPSSTPVEVPLSDPLPAPPPATAPA